MLIWIVKLLYFVAFFCFSHATSSNASVCGSPFKAMFYHMAFHGGTTVCNVACENPCVRCPNGHRFSKCWVKETSYKGTPYDFLSEPFDFVMSQTDELHALRDEAFPLIHPLKIKYVISVRHPLPHAAKIMAFRDEQVAKHSDLALLSGHFRGTRVQDGVSHKASKLDIAKEVLRRFGIILLLDHFAETIPLLCAELNWQHCTARVKAHNEKIYKERSQNILNHARQIWPPRNSTKGPHTSLEKWL